MASGGALEDVLKWEHDVDTFCQTRAYNHAQKQLDEKGMVVITGRPGDGRNATAQQLLLSYNNLGYDIEIIDSPQEYSEIWDPTRKQVFFVREIEWKSPDTNKNVLHNWLLFWQDFSRCVDGSVTKVVSTFKYSIYLNWHRWFKVLERFVNIVDISSEEWRLSLKEKLDIIKSYQKKIDVEMDVHRINSILDKNYIQGFPFRCKLFFSERRHRMIDAKYFTGSLMKTIVHDLTELQNASLTKYMCLVMLVMCGGEIPETIANLSKAQTIGSRIGLMLGWTSIEPTGVLFESLKQTLGVSHTFSLVDLVTHLNALIDNYVAKRSTVFSFLHETVGESVAVMFGSSFQHQDMYIRHCTLSDIQDRITPMGEHTLRGIPSVVVRPCNFQTLAARITAEVEYGNSIALIGCPWYFHGEFSKAWVKYLEQLPPKRLKAVLQTEDCRGVRLYIHIARQGSVALIELVLKTLEVPNASQLMLHAASNGQTEAVKLLVTKGANINERTSDGQTALLLSSLEGHVSLASCLLEHGAAVNIIDDHGCSPLHSACLSGQMSVVTDLINSGSVVNACDATGSTSLFYASFKGHDDVVQELLRCGAEVNIFNNLGGDAILAACAQGHYPVVKLLLEKGPNLKHTDCNGKTPLHWACQRGFNEIVELLLSKGVDVTLSDDRKQTPLHLAAAKGHSRIWRSLVGAGADMYITDVNGNTPVAQANVESKIPSLFSF